MSFRKPSLSAVVGTLFALYGLLLCLMLFMRYLRTGHSVPISAINVSITVLLMPVLMFFPIALLLRRWIAAALLAPPFIVFMVAYLPLFLPRPIATPPEDAPRLTLLTYNLHAEKTILSPMFDVVDQADADIVAFQEMSPEAGAMR